MKSKKKVFSIITPILNNPDIEKVFNSLDSQSFKNFEHIVVDGGSNKETLKIIKKNKKKINKLIIEKDYGIYDAINKGIRVSNGEIIGILNADDYYYFNTLELVNNYFKKKKIDYIFGSVLKDRLMHNFLPKKIWYKFNVYPAHSCGFFIKKELHRDINLGLYDLNFKYSSDRDFIYRLINSNYKGLCSKKYEIFGRFSPNGISSKLSFLRTFIEEMSVRFKNQNFLLIILIALITLFNKVLNIFVKKRV